MTKIKKGARRTGSTQARKSQTLGTSDDQNMENKVRKIRTHCDGQSKPAQRGPRGRV